MKEAEWLAATDPMPMYRFLWRNTSDRKFRLFGSACVRLVCSSTCDEVPSEIATVEKFADGCATKAAMKKARTSLRQKRHVLDTVVVEMRQKWLCYWLAEVAASEKAYGFILSELVRLSSEVQDISIPESDALTGLFRELFGNPFHSIVVDPSWLTSTVLALAECIYADQAFDRCSILADALQDSGCDHEDLLNHLRSPGPHYKGCWALDLVLGRT